MDEIVNHLMNENFHLLASIQNLWQSTANEAEGA